MACLNFKNGPKNGLGPLGVNMTYFLSQINPNQLLLPIC
jgi:hypothetical protein